MMFARFVFGVVTGLIVLTIGVLIFGLWLTYVMIPLIEWLSIKP